MILDRCMESNLNTSCPWWYFDDFLECFRYKYLDFEVPFFALTIAIIGFILHFFFLRKRERNHKFADDESRPLMTNNTSYGSTLLKDERSSISIKERHFDLMRLPNVSDDGTPHGQSLLVSRSSSDRLRFCLEYVLVFSMFAISISSIFMDGFRSEWKGFKIPIVKALFWGLLFLLINIRVILYKSKIYIPDLWSYSTVLYAINFLTSICTFRSSIIGSVKNSTIKNYYGYLFLIAFVLLALNITSTVGDKPITLYFTSDGLPPSPERQTSILKFYTYAWLDKMIFGAYKSPLLMKDIWGLREDDYAYNVMRAFESYKSTLNFSLKLFSFFKFYLFLQAAWAILEALIAFVPSLLLMKILQYIEDPNIMSNNLAWTIVILIPVVKIIEATTSGCCLFIGRRICTRMRAILVSEVYGKALRRKVTVSKQGKPSESGSGSASKNQNKEVKNDGEGEKKTAELGAIINLMSIDTYKVSEICGYLHYFLQAVLMLVVSITLLYKLLGWSAMIGAVSVVILFPVNYYVVSLLGKYLEMVLKVTDERVQSLNEIFLGIRIIKYFAWEERFYEKVMRIRSNELEKLRLKMAVWASTAFVWYVTPTIVTMTSFYCYSMIQGKDLTASVAFTALSLFTLLRTPLELLAGMTSYVIQCKVSLDRVSNFLDEEETSKYNQIIQDTNTVRPFIGFKNATFSWEKDSEDDFKLREMNVRFEPNSLNVIVGPTGSGKSSFILALLGEMECLDGEVFLPGVFPRYELDVDRSTGLTESVAYCAQSPWLLNDTIRNNILFGSPFVQHRYDSVIDACGLRRDLQILGAGDATEIGEKGITLSGGQKQRVSLARALYSNSRHVLLDDCLSAVDSHTALWIYENCICGPLMAGRTCILVSHNVALTVQNAYFVVMMDNGRIKAQGSPEELLTSGHLGGDELVASSICSSRASSTSKLKGLDGKSEKMKADVTAIDAKLKAVTGLEEVDKNTSGKLVEDESKAEGALSFDVFKSYMKSFGGKWVWIFLLFVYFFAEGVHILQNWWLREWSLRSQVNENTNILATSFSKTLPNIAYESNLLLKLALKSSLFHQLKDFRESVQSYSTNHSVMFYLIIYSAIGIFYSVVSCLRLLVTFDIGIVAANDMFKRLLRSVLGAKMRFFDQTPLGRIMNRFSKDVEAVDQEISSFGEAAFISVVECLSSLLLISFITPGFLVFAVIIGSLYYFVGFFYLTLSRELKRYESISKSPIHQHFSETLVGVATIRAFGVEPRFLKQNLDLVDTNNRPFFYLWVANRWLAFRADLVGSFVLLFAGIMILLAIGNIDAGLAGLSLTSAIGFSESALWIVRLYSNLEMNMNSVERVQEYYRIEQEPQAVDSLAMPRETWPETGAISIRNLSLRYSPDLPLVIKNASFDVQPNHKVGVVGRTGAGKSTIITAFFRFVEYEEGNVLIDGIDISKIDLKKLRSSITIIPQDPTLFSGTIRSNLDPFDAYSDSQIFKALERVNLIKPKEHNTNVNNMENRNKFLNLKSDVAEGGSNLSQGQRQLMCLARSLLRSPKVILLDEATASIDYESDAVIQKTIRKEFGHSTILTIAHRLRSIIDYDKILVMEAGKVVEYDHPYKLLSNKNSLFYSMCSNTGEMDALCSLAKDAYKNTDI